MVKISNHIENKVDSSKTTAQDSPREKIVVLLFDVLSLRNFLFMNFHQTAREFDIVYWNSTPVSLANPQYNEVKIPESRLNALTDILKRSRKYIELNLNSARVNDPTYHSYKLRFINANIKSAVKNVMVKCCTSIYSTESGIIKIRKRIDKNERCSDSYLSARERFLNDRPSIVFCTSQRATNAIAPVLAAKDLKIPTATFIYSWDNMPKAIMLVETDYYFVWSAHMKQELLHYYPFVKENQIFITGTPQFEMHSNKTALLSKDVFHKRFNLDISKRYICFSGDDATTSPNDSYYLEDVAKAVRRINSEGQNIGIIFRRCPVDFTSRFDTVLEECSDVITSIDPAWQRDSVTGKAFPTADDTNLLLDTINNTEFVINLGSSMVFDYALFNKSTAYIKYDVKDKPVVNPLWNVNKIYNYVHFRSMPTQDVVAWIKSPDEIYDTIKKMLSGEINTAANALEWFKIINENPADLASERIVDACRSIVANSKMLVTK